MRVTIDVKRTGPPLARAERKPGKLLKTAVGIVLGTAAVAFQPGCATTTYRTWTGVAPPSPPPVRLVDAGARLSPMAAVRLPGATAPEAQPDPGALGPFGVLRTSCEIPCGTDGQGRAIAAVADVYLPEGAGSFAPVVHCHGLWSDKRQHQGTAAHYASHGFVVVVPDMPFGSDAAKQNAVAISHVVDWVTTKPAVLGPQLSLDHGVMLSGHSFGGLTATLAATNPHVTTLVALDAARQGNTGMDASSSLHGKVMYVMGERELANQMGNGKDLFDAMTSATKQFVRVRRATHTDFQNDRLDGPKNDGNRSAMTWATSFLLSSCGDARYAPWVDGAERAAALARGAIAGE